MPLGIKLLPLTDAAAVCQQKLKKKKKKHRRNQKKWKKKLLRLLQDKYINFALRSLQATKRYKNTCMPQSHTLCHCPM